LENSGHWPFVDAAAVVADRLAAFLDTVPHRGGVARRRAI
jgi:hypothetical protein